METKAWAHEVRAFTRFRSADGSEGVTAIQAGVQFKNGLYVGGNFSGAGIGTTFDNITILGTGGNGWIAFSAQSVAPSLATGHLYADAAGRMAFGHSGTTAHNAIFDNQALSATRSYVFPDKNGTFAIVGDNISEFTNDSGYVAGPVSATDNRVALFNGTTGKIIKDSGILSSQLVLTSRTISEGAGLAGNTYDLSANRTLAMGTPSTNSVSSINSASGTTHTHAITTSSNPGAAASILATDSSGFLRLTRLGIGATPTQPLHVAGNAFLEASTTNLYMKDTATGFQVAATGVVTLQSGNALRTSGFSSGVSGWNESDNGDAEFNNVRIRGELAASVFKISEISATAGTFGVFYSASTLAADVAVVNAIGDFVTIRAKNSDAGGMLFGVGDILRIKSWTGSGVSDTWFNIGTRTNNGTTTDYGCQIKAGTVGVTYHTGTAIVDYGPSATGFITLSADGTIGSTPNLTMATHAGSPWSAQTTLSRLGNLNGSYGYATDVFGLGVGQYGAASKSWVTVEQTNGIRIGNNTSTLAQWDTSGNILIGQTGASQGNVYITSGAVQLRTNTTVNVNLASTGDVTLGNVATDQASAFWDNTSKQLKFRGGASGTSVQSYIDTDGSFNAGNGNVKLNASGLTVNSGNVYSANAAVSWLSGSTLAGDVFNLSSSGTQSSTLISSYPVTSGDRTIAVMRAMAAGGTNRAVFEILNDPSDSGAYAFIGSNAETFKGFVVGQSAVGVPSHMLDVYGTGWFQGLLSAGAGINVGNGFMSGYHSTFKVATNEQFHWRGHLNLSTGVCGAAANDADSANVPIEWRASQFLLSGGNVGIGATSFGTSAAGVLGIADGTAPTSSPAGMGQLYCENGALKWRGSSGSITVLGVA